MVANAMRLYRLICEETKETKVSRPQLEYRVRNWSEYNAALVKRGSLTVWLDEAALSDWMEPHRSGRRGASRTCSQAAIQAILLLKAVYHLPLRGAQSLVESLLKLMGLSWPVPHYST